MCRSQQLPPPGRKTTGDNWSFRKIFGMGQKEEQRPTASYYTPDVSYCTTKYLLNVS
jgi:hypothetical protein